ncbi:MAG: cytochrome c biogenesis protein CcsA [Dehalococcoidia bacterium]|nr:cytochrome c biogenesis protein CcsA [Dehalococcoidia bacterium]
MKDKVNMWTGVAILIAFVLMAVALYGALVFSPEEKQLGNTIRILYVHVPSAWIALVAFGIVSLSSVLFLWKRNLKWDTLARSSAEVGLIFTSLALISGSIWARSFWGWWWTWDPRLTSTLILWLIYLAYLMVRSYATEESRGARYAAVVAIIGFVDVPIIYLTTRLWNLAHPPPTVARGALDPIFVWVLMVSLAAFTLLYIILLTRTVEQKNLQREIDQLRQSLK